MKLYKMDVVTRRNNRIETPVGMQPGERSMRFSRRIAGHPFVEECRFRHEDNSSRNTGEGDRFDRDGEREREREGREEKKNSYLRAEKAAGPIGSRSSDARS